MKIFDEIAVKDSEKNRDFNYNDFDAETQAFIRLKTNAIKQQVRQLGSRNNLFELQAIYTIGEKLVEVRNHSNKCFKKYFELWLGNEVIKESEIKSEGTAYSYIYLYNYVSKYLGGIDGLKTNHNIDKSALYTLGKPGTSDVIKQKFADIAKSGKQIRQQTVNQAIMQERKVEVGEVDKELAFSTDDCLNHEINNASPELAIRTHTKTQGMLAKLGLQLCDFVWIAPDNRSEIWRNEKLGDLSIDTLPKIGTDPTEEKIIPYIDVIWLSDNQRIEAVFEIECTTLIYSGLLRMTDLMRLYPNLSFNFYVVIPKSRVNKVKQQLSRPTFKALKLHHKCKWLVIEELEQHWDSMMNWGSAPDTIDRIAYSLIDERH